MDHIRAVLTHPEEMSVEARLNLHGVQQLLEQEGLPLAVCVATELQSHDWQAGDVLVVAEQECLTAAAEAAICVVASDRPLVWCGLPREDASPDLMRLLGIAGIGTSREGLLRRLELGEHPICAPFDLDAERRLKVKHIPHLQDQQRRIAGEPVLSLSLMDGHALGPGLVVREERPRRAVWTFPPGLLFALATCRHIDIRVDAEWLDWPLMTYADTLRGILRETIRWSLPELPLARKALWPRIDGRRPTAVGALTHDLCGYSEEGVRFICETCERYGVHTTFFDMPPLRLDRGEVGDNCIALHVSGGTSYEDIVLGLGALEERHEREVPGWRRHGRTEIEHYPHIWRSMERAGVQWSNTFPTQSHPNRATCSPCGTSNRLPFDIMDLETGRRLELLELPIFDTDDADRLSNIAYGMRLTWERFRDVVEQRLDYAAGRGLVAGYLLHGWTAGATEEAGRTYGAPDAKRMLGHFIEASRERGMALMTGDEMHRWWQFRRRAELQPGETSSIAMPGGEWTLEVEALDPFGP
ncbi:MAG: hypothetical protein U9R79_18200 [Armatimonadota bacterium]|nr:hypothetical protein [Armatimonadota bacterium]